MSQGRRGGRRVGLSKPLVGAVAAVAVALTLATAPSVAMADVLRSADEKIARSAFKAAKAGDWKKARRLIAKARHPLPAKILRWMDFRRIGTKVDFEDVGRFVALNPDWPEQSLLRRRAEEMINDKTPVTLLLKWFARFPPVSTDGKIRYGTTLRAAGVEQAGWEILRDAWLNGNFGKRSEKQFYRRYRKLLSREDHRRRLDRLIWEGRYWPARRMLWKVSKRRRALAEARLVLMSMRGNADRTVANVPAHLQNDPGLIYERLRWRRRKGLDSAAEFLVNPPPDMVYPAKWWEERAVIARRILQKGHVSEAYRMVKDHGIDRSNAAAFAEAEWTAGWIALRFLAEYEVAWLHFATMYNAVRYPVSRARGAYWAARAALALKRPKEAAVWLRKAADHPTAYYGQLAATRLGGDRSVWLPPDPVPDFQTLEAFDRHELVAAVRVLAQIGAVDQLRPFIKALSAVSESAAWRTLTASLARRHGRPDLALGVAKRMGRDGRALIGAGYPTLALPRGAKGNVKARPERPLVLAVIRQESAFRTEAKSHAGARGLMQLLPRTARTVAKGLKIPYSKTRLTKEPAFNVILGQAYLGELINEFKGSYVLALAAYNAGPGRARRWLKINGDPRESVTEAIDWIELIPFEETRNYIQRVMEGLQIYRGRQNGARMAITLDRDLIQGIKPVP